MADFELIKRFLKKVFLFFNLLVILVAGYVLLIYLHPELVDDFYYRFTTPKAHSLILGTSRPAQGLRPDIINDCLFGGERKMLNHSFAVGPSNYGPNYYREIQKKLDNTTVNGIYIIAVDPWSLATGIENVNDDTAKFYEVENNLFVGNIKSSSQNPNFDYLLNYWAKKFNPFLNIFKIAINYKNLYFLNKDGWLEVTVPMDDKSVNQRIETLLSDYSPKLMMLSNTRFAYLSRIIEFLNKHGEVYLVRLPVSEAMASLENEKFNDFDDKVLKIAAMHQVKYINFFELSGNYKTIDGHHLYKEDGALLTRNLCDSLFNHHHAINDVLRLSNVE